MWRCTVAEENPYAASEETERPPRRREGVGIITLDPDAPDVGQQHHRALPDVTVQTGRGQLLARDRVRGAQGLQPVLGDLADDPDAQAGPREGLAVHDRLRQAQLQPHPADLVL